MKRFFNSGTEDRIPAVEKLYKQNQETYATAGGFDEDDDWSEENREKISEAAQRKRDLPFEHLVAPDECKDCGGPLYSDSILWNRFNFPVCDLCRDETDRHKLIARTEAKERYLLKDCDLDLRKPPLRFISRKNPHNARYGDMKLYLKPQLEARALELYGSFDNLEEQREKRERQRKATAEKRFEQKIQQIRKEISGSSRQAAMRAASVHEHKFGEEMRDEKSGEYRKRCTVCGYEMRYEKM